MFSPLTLGVAIRRAFRLKFLFECWHGVNSTSIKDLLFSNLDNIIYSPALKSADATRCRAASGRKQHYYYRLYGVSKLRLSASYLPARRAHVTGRVRRATRLR